MVLMRAQGHIPVRRQRKDGTNGTDGAQGYSIVTSVTRNNFTEAQWATYGTTGHTESWSNTSSIRNGARVGDLFTVVGTATDTGNGHTATYRCDNASGDLHGVCISHEISNAGKDSLNATITKNVGVVECNANGVTTSEKTVDANVSFEKGGVAQTITGIVCKINDTTEIGTSYAPDGAAANFKKSTTLNTGYVQITIKSGTSLVTPVKIVITVSASINGTTQNRKVTLTIQGSVPGQKGDQGKIGRWYEYAGEYGKDLAATLSNTDSHGWWVKRGNNCFQLIASSGTTVQTSTIPTTATSNATWELMAGDTRKFFIGAAFFGDYAQFGAAIINGDWMISKNGSVDGVQYVNGASIDGESVPAYTHFDPLCPNGKDRRVYSNPDPDPGPQSWTELARFDLTKGFTYNIIAGSNQNIRVKINGLVIVTGTDVGSIRLTAPTTGEYSLEYKGGGGVTSIIVQTVNAFVPNYCVDLLKGKLYAIDALISGDINAKLIYRESVVISENTSISNNPKGFYLIDTSQAEDDISINLPHPTDYPDVEIQFFVDQRTTNYTASIHCWYNDEWIIYKDSDGRQREGSFELQPFTLVTIKAIGNNWYVITGA